MASTKMVLEGSPAGQPTDAVGQQPEGVLVASARDQRVLDWLVAQVGCEAVAAACHDLAGRRRPYVSNLAKALGLTPPADLALTPPDVAREHLAKIRALLSGRLG